MPRTSRSRSPRRRHSRSPPRRRSRSPEAWGSHQHDVAYDRSNPRSKSPPKEKQKPNYGLSGLLAAATNTKHGVVMKYNEPSEARKCKGWRIYVFKDGKEVDVLNLDRQSSYLVGRDRIVTDIPVDHTSCSSQHAVIQFRQVNVKNEFGDVDKRIKYPTSQVAQVNIRPYIIDLDSTNGTELNGEKIESRRYFEIRTEDMLKFGESTREYIFIKDPSAV
jgi:smad nuclear-interacting protein 1